MTPRTAVRFRLRSRPYRGVSGWRVLGGHDGGSGERAERVAEARIRAALPEGSSCYPNVTFLAKGLPQDPAHDGEADLVVVDPITPASLAARFTGR